MFKKGSKVGGPEIGAAYRGHGPSGPIAFGAYEVNGVL